ncbi:MAG TPA: FliA/WhiG family RNA polymerase sigma factor [Deltaproteobacteria bacterium]|nr:FliA/WhiG family RNA polymerase sigma factor [Deltaproteobacteria bacterium]
MRAVLSRMKEYSPQMSREDLILEYIPLVKYLAQRIASRLPQNVELEDLINAGVIGLIDAVEKYDPSKRIKFRTYAEFRIKGAIFDELRSQDVLPRSWRQKIKELEEAYLRLEQRLGRTPTEEEVAEEMHISIEEFHQSLKEVRSINFLSMDGLIDPTCADKGRLRDILMDPEEKDPLEVLGLAELREILAKAIDELPERHRLVVALYYYEELTMKEIAEVLGVSESRISQIHSQAILSLRAKLKKVLGRDAEGR